MLFVRIPPGEKLEVVGKKRAANIVIATFHAFCLKVLRKHIEHIGYRRNFTIAGESDSRALLRRVVDELPAQARGFNPATFQSTISLFKSADEAPDADGASGAGDEPGAGPEGETSGSEGDDGAGASDSAESKPEGAGAGPEPESEPSR